MATHLQRSVEAALFGHTPQSALSEEQTLASLLEENFQLRTVVIDLLLELEKKKEAAAFS